MAQTIKLNIKSPTSDEDKSFSTSLEATVKEVKCQIEKEWPSHPSLKDQRLVYAGKMLENHSVLKEVLRLDDARDENDAFTIHLICRNFIHTAPTYQIPPSTVKTSASENDLRRRNNVEQPSSSASNPQNPLPTNTATSPQSNNLGGAAWNNTQDQQAVLMQQMYANYMTQYVQYLQSIGALNTWPNAASQSLVEHTNQIADEARAGGAAPGVHAQGAPVFDHVHAAAAVAGAANLANNLQQPQAVAAQPQAGAQPGLHNQPNVQNGVINQVPGENGGQNMAGPGGPDGPLVMNAGAGVGGGMGAMEDEDDMNGGQRDVLDWCYVVTRVLVLFSVVYFYSSLARFALAAGLGIIFYLYNNGFFGHPAGRARPHQDQQQQQNQQNHEAAVNEVRQVAGAAGDAHGANPDDPADPNEADGEAGGADTRARTEEIALPPPPQYHPLNVLSTFVTTFFTSLLPNDPQVV